MSNKYPNQLVKNFSVLKRSNKNRYSQHQNQKGFKTGIWKNYKYRKTLQTTPWGSNEKMGGGEKL
ncbi:hypothetical protein BpHYR1_053492 [Brachionus plicatilis]|uniref:Uncharacterized protein n=1 Tax=Brachionus plicatilis TaxID=10195 RepID=A0A3M7R392_BRAPC|nr:hypothetical protein BpHYR1_053492 [Brachionus plicatilis]